MTDHPAEHTSGAFAVLDVRPILSAGEDPFDTIMATLRALPRDGVLVLTASFEPRPLIAHLGRLGYHTEARSYGAEVWDVEIRGPSAPRPLDLRELPAPEPLERVLLACAGLDAGALLLARLPRVPRLLLPRLVERGHRFDVHETREGTALLVVRRPA